MLLPCNVFFSYHKVLATKIAVFFEHFYSEKQVHAYILYKL